MLVERQNATRESPCYITVGS